MVDLTLEKPMQMKSGPSDASRFLSAIIKRLENVPFKITKYHKEYGELLQREGLEITFENNKNFSICINTYDMTSITEVDQWRVQNLNEVSHV